MAVGRHRGEPRARVQAPWSSKGWYADEIRRGRDPEILRIYEVAGRGKVNPIGYREGTPALAVSPATHNPWLRLPLALIGAGAGAFLFVQLSASPVWAWLAGGAFWAIAVLIIVTAIRQIPSWHRARRMVREYLAEHPGKFPLELRWYQ